MNNLAQRTACPKIRNSYPLVGETVDVWFLLHNETFQQIENTSNFITWFSFHMIETRSRCRYAHFASLGTCTDVRESGRSVIRGAEQEVSRNRIIQRRALDGCNARTYTYTNTSCETTSILTQNKQNDNPMGTTIDVSKHMDKYVPGIQKGKKTSTQGSMLCRGS